MLQDRLVAHRGFQKAYPENTLLAHRMAIAAGAHFIETDIQFSADFQPVLYHDLAMKRLSGVENLVSNLTLAELARIPLHEPDRFGQRYIDEPIAPLGDLVALLAQHPGVCAFVEIKRSALQFAGLDKTLDILLPQLAPVAEQAVLISFDYDAIAAAHRRGWRRLGMVLQAWEDQFSPPVAATPLEFLFCDLAKIPGEADLAAIAPKLVVYEVDDPGLARALFARGADMVETFDIGGMIQALARKAL
ncbi:MAG: glycerophosphodiester phosphodiesterase family protein [Porticoccaceae bacterium]